MPKLNTASNIYLGSATVDRVYLGVEQVWPFAALLAESGDTLTTENGDTLAPEGAS